MPPSVEYHMLPNLVADGDGAEFGAIARQQLDLIPRVDDAAGIERVVEDDGFRARRKGGVEIILVECPMGRFQRDEFRRAASASNQRQIGVVHRLKQHDLVAGFDSRENGAGESLGRARCHHGLHRRVDVDALEALVVRGDGRAQFRQAHHRRILIVAVHQRLGGLAPDILRTRAVGETLAEIDGPLFPREGRHDLEDRGGQVGENRIHSGVSDGVL